MKIVFAAAALVFAAPALAQGAPAPGQHANHGSRHGQDHGGHHGHKPDGEKKECLEACCKGMKPGEKMACCDKMKAKKPAEPKHEGHSAHH